MNNGGSNQKRGCRGRRVLDVLFGNDGLCVIWSSLVIEWEQEFGGKEKREEYSVIENLIYVSYCVK